MVIKLDDRKILKGRPHPLPWPICCDADAYARSACHG